MKIYQDSKELPLFNYERILETNDFLYMIKGYDGEPIENANKEELEEKFNEIVREFVVSINSKDINFLNYGNAQRCYMEISRLETLHNIIVLKIEENKLKTDMGLEIDNSIVWELLKQVKMPKSEDLEQILKTISSKISKYQNDLNITLAKIEKDQEEAPKEQDINKMITNVELILERTIDMEKTSLYRFGIMQQQAINKIKKLEKYNH